MQAKAKSNTTVIRRMLDVMGEVTEKFEDCRSLEWEVPTVGKLKLALSDVSTKVDWRAKIHGLSARVGDAAAVSADKATGKTDPKAKFAAMKALVDHYASGSEDWGPARAAGGATGPRLDPMVIAAVAEAVSKSEEEVRAMIAAGAEKNGCEPKDYLLSLSKAKAVKPILERMREEAASKVEIDGDAELDGLMG